ncbi:hypothetical protein AAULR_09380, partial [Lacticaseibacillus rhamnosus MTCC 5462]
MSALAEMGTFKTFHGWSGHISAKKNEFSRGTHRLKLKDNLFWHDWGS